MKSYFLSSYHDFAAYSYTAKPIGFCHFFGKMSFCDTNCSEDVGFDQIVLKLVCNSAKHSSFSNLQIFFNPFLPCFLKYEIVHFSLSHLPMQEHLRSLFLHHFSLIDTIFFSPHIFITSVAGEWFL